VTDGAIDVYYDRLTRFSAWARILGYGGGRENLTVHRALADPSRAGHPTTTRLHDLLFEQLAALKPGCVLDAGCGLGGTMIDLAKRMPSSFIGLTLSPKQAAIARRAIATADLADRVSVETSSYDTPPSGPFGAIYALESLAHSRRPEATLAALAASLEPGGTIVVIDDMPLGEAAGDPDLVAFKRGWQLPVLWSAEDYAVGFASLGLALVANHDLSASLRPRGRLWLDVLSGLNRWAFRLVPIAAARMIIDSYEGGLALERLYSRSRMSYRLLVAQKPFAS
jgi:SAM-dependent methyltransferase